MKKGLCELVFILDRSGSMHGLESDTVGGFNSLVEKQKKEAGECFISTVLFDHKSEIIHDRVKLSEITPMTEKEYFTGGSTALLDAVGSTIYHIGSIHKYAREEDIPEKTVFFITTDGMENSSITYTKDRVKAMIEEKKQKDGWEFIFLGANIDAVSTAAGLGIGADRTANYCCDSKGTALNFSVMANAISNMRACPSAKLSENWKAEIEQDHAKRGNKK